MGVHPATTINLGSTGIFHSAAFHLIVSDYRTDLGVDSLLASLGILGIELTGPDAAAFSVDDLIPASLRRPAREPADPFSSRRNHRLPSRPHHSHRPGAANGAAGQTFAYQLVSRRGRSGSRTGVYGPIGAPGGIGILVASPLDERADGGTLVRMSR